VTKVLLALIVLRLLVLKAVMTKVSVMAPLASVVAILVLQVRTVILSRIVLEIAQAPNMVHARTVETASVKTIGMELIAPKSAALIVAAAMACVSKECVTVTPPSLNTTVL